MDIKKKPSPEDNKFLEILDYIQTAYKKRDSGLINEFMQKLFAPDDNCHVIGTSINEWCLGKKEVKELFLGDWEYWGDLKLDIQSARIYDLGSICCLYIPATVKYSPRMP